MRITTREIIDKVTFSNDEIMAFKNLHDVVQKCCEAYSDYYDYQCEGCPFADHCCGRTEILDFLTDVIVNHVENED